MDLIRTSHLNQEEATFLTKLCVKYNDIFQQDDIQLSFTNQVKHEILLQNDKPIHTKSYRYPHVHKEEVQNQIAKMLQQGIIRPSFSPWSSPIWIVPKKQDASGKAKWRLVIDYRKLNEQTIDDRYPLPNILQYPDFNKQFLVTTDASNVAIGGILSQGTIGSDLPICYASRTLTKTEGNYSTIEKELLAIVWTIKYFRPYLFGRKFTIITDHKPLTWLFSLKEPNSKLIRWRLKLEEYDYNIVYKTIGNTQY